MNDTIFAQATPPGRSGVAVVRVSGPRAFAVVERAVGHLPTARTAGLRRITDPRSGDILDQGLVLAFPGPATFTGEDIVELQVHGSLAVTRAIAGWLDAEPGLRLAEPGEFTRRALANGRVAFGEVEGLADLLVAETAAQRRQALAVMGGALARTAQRWRPRLVKSLAFIEASIDFADEALPDDLLRRIQVTLADISGEMQREVRAGHAAERLREGFEVALVGRPNAGKSTLLNALAGREVALTSAQAGTTRDVIEVRLDLKGLAVTLLDMAGLRDADGIEAIAIDRARARADAADLRVFLVAVPGEADTLGVARSADDLVATGKADLGTAPGLAVSGLTGAGIDDLLAAIADTLRARAAGAGALSHDRQRAAVRDAAAMVVAAGETLALGEAGVDLAAEHLRGALRALDFLVGRVDVEAILDVVFEQFCLGK